MAPNEDDIIPDDEEDAVAETTWTPGPDMAVVEPGLRRGPGIARRVNFRAARALAIRWRAEVRAGATTDDLPGALRRYAAGDVDEGARRRPRKRSAAQSPNGLFAPRRGRGGRACGTTREATASE